MRRQEYKSGATDAFKAFLKIAEENRDEKDNGFVHLCFENKITPKQN